MIHLSYLGSLISKDKLCKKDVRSRIARAKNAFSNRKEFLTKFCTLDLNKRIVKIVIWSTLLYGAESWALRKDDIPRLESCEMWLWRKILNISWTDKNSNKEVLQRVNEDRAIIPSIYKKQRTWLGHTLRHGNLLPLIIEGRVGGRRPPEGPRTGMLDRIKNGSSYQCVKKRARERKL